MAYQMFRGDEPHEVIRVRIFVDEGANTLAMLRASGPAAKGVARVLLPNDSMSVQDALNQANILSIKYGAPIRVQVEDGAVWNQAWGQISDHFG